MPRKNHLPTSEMSGQLRRRAPMLGPIITPRPIVARSLSKATRNLRLPLAMAVWVWLLALPLAAHDIINTKLTYTRDISRILARRCASCHGEGSALPLTTYREVRPWAVAIKQQVLSRAMPPWGAVRGFRDLAPDDALPEQEIQLIAGWVVGGAPEGDSALLAQLNPAEAEPREQGRRAWLAISTRTVLTKPLTVVGIMPLPEEVVESTRILARLANGRIEPLLWLYHYDPRWRRIFRFREPLELPRGTVIESSSPLRFTLQGPATNP